MFFYYCKQ